MSKKKAKVKARPKQAKRHRQTKEELVKLAEDILNGLVYTSRHLDSPAEITRVFAVLGFMSGKSLAQFKKAKPELLYEYMDKAAPLGCNGKPMFFSLHSLTKTESEEMWGYYNKMRDAREEAKKAL